MSHAEAAVANDPQNAEYRALLGQAYLLAGRFASANQALGRCAERSIRATAMRRSTSFSPRSPAATGPARARCCKATRTLSPPPIAASAYALAGDPVKAVEILGPAARAEDATAKTFRQNPRRWRSRSPAAGAEAKQVASVDVAPDQIGARIMQWVTFARAGQRL